MSYTGSVNQFTKVMSDAWEEVTKLKPDDSQRNIEGVIKTLSQILPSLNEVDIRALTGKIKNIVKLLDRTETELDQSLLVEIQIQFFESCFPEPTNFSILGELANISKTSADVSNYYKKNAVFRKLFNVPGRFNLLIKACETCLNKGDKNEIESLLNLILIGDKPADHQWSELNTKQKMIFALLSLSAKLKDQEIIREHQFSIIKRSIEDSQLVSEAPDLLTPFEATKNKLEGKGIYKPPTKKIGEIWEIAHKIQREIRNSHDLTNVSSSEKREINRKIDDQINKQIDAALPTLKEDLSKLLRNKETFENVTDHNYLSPKTTLQLIEILYKIELYLAFLQMSRFSQYNDISGAKELLNSLSSADRQMLLQLALEEFIYHIKLDTFLFIIKISEINPSILSNIENHFRFRFLEHGGSENYPKYYTQIIEALIFTKNVQDFYENILSSVQRCFASSNFRWRPHLTPLVISLGIADNPEDVIKLIRDMYSKGGAEVRMVDEFNSTIRFDSHNLHTIQLAQDCRKAAKPKLQEEMGIALDTHGIGAGDVLDIIGGYTIDALKVTQRTLQLMDKKFLDFESYQEKEQIEPQDFYIEYPYRKDILSEYDQMERLLRENNVEEAEKTLKTLKPNIKQLLLELALRRWENEGSIRFPTFIFILKNIGTVNPIIMSNPYLKFGDLNLSEEIAQECVETIEALMLAPNNDDFFENLKSSVKNCFLLSFAKPKIQLAVQVRMAPLLILLNIVKEPREVIKMVSDEIRLFLDEINQQGMMDRMKQAIECRELAKVELRQILNDQRDIHRASRDVVGIMAEYAYDDAALARHGMMRFKKK